jgi:dTMP kinase
LFEQTQILENFIVLEGIDGAGTTTQLDLIDAELTRLALAHVKTCEPTSGPVGSFIRTVLRGNEQVQPGTLALLFAADRYEHLHEPLCGIMDLHESGKLVISDRYLFSSLAYQSIDTGMDFPASINRDFPLPSHLFFIDIPIDVCMERLASRKNTEIFEVRYFQEKVISAYKKTLSLFSDTRMKIYLIDGTLPRDTVFGKIWEIIRSLPIFKG